MKYSSWTNNRWEILEKPGPSVSVDYIAEFTIKEIKNNLNNCLNIIRNHYGGNVSPKELEELAYYLQKFVLDHQP